MHCLVRCAKAVKLTPHLDDFAVKNELFILKYLQLCEVVLLAEDEDALRVLLVTGCCEIRKRLRELPSSLTSADCASVHLLADCLKFQRIRATQEAEDG